MQATGVLKVTFHFSLYVNQNNGNFFPIIGNGIRWTVFLGVPMRSVMSSFFLQGGPKIGTISLYASTLPNINRFSKLFHSQNQEKICNNTITKDPTTPQVCRYTTL